MSKNESPSGIQEMLLEQAGKLFDKLPMLGPIVWLLSQTPSHRHLFIGDLDWRVMPPVSLSQCKLYVKDNAPLAYVSWAKVNDDVAKRLAMGNLRLAPAEWACGDNIWLIDVIAPFGGVGELMKDLQGAVFEGKQVFYLAPDESGKGLLVKTMN